METTVKELPDSRVRVDVDVDPKDVEGSINEDRRQLGEDMKMPGFRKGKVPPEMVVQRLGREAVLTQALETSLGRLVRARDARVGGQPGRGPEARPHRSAPARASRCSFSIEVAVRPKAELGEYKGLEVGREKPEVPEEAIETELNRLREGFARLNPVDREAEEGDVVLIDYEGKIDGEPFEGGAAKRLPARAGGGARAARAGAGARGGEGRRASAGRRSPSRRTIPPRRSRARRRSSRSR